jgi:hypothetical protein
LWLQPPFRDPKAGGITLQTVGLHGAVLNGKEHNMKVCLPAPSGRRRSRVVGCLLALAAVVATSSMALANATPASAHSVDSHQHGWTYVSPTQTVACTNDIFLGGGTAVSMFWPEVKSPLTVINGKKYLSKVHLIAELQYYDFGIPNVRSAGWRHLNYSVPYHTYASDTSFAGGWVESETNRYAQPKLRFDNPTPGYYYRIIVWYHWDVDNVWHSDVTNYCKP